VELPLRPRPVGAAVGAHDLSRLEHLLEAAQVIAQLLLWLLPEQGRNERTERAG
jgi:hypothetical protein